MWCSAVMTSRTTRFVSFLVSLALLAPGASRTVAREATPADPAFASRLDALASLYERLGIFNGTVLLARNGDIVFQKGYGMASYELGVANGPETRFRIASLSKPITRLAIGRLYEAGKLELDTALDRFVPEYPHASRITIRQLLDHRGGVPHLNGLDWYERESRNHIDLPQIVDRLSELPLDFEPGEDRSYSNGGYALLALVIERASSLAFGDYLRTEILEPLGMTATGHDRHDLLLEHRAAGYVPGPIAGQRVPAQYVEPSIKIGGGSLYSTVGDLLKLDVALFHDNVIRRSTWKQLFEPRDGEIWYTGRAPGFYSVWRRRLADAWTLIVLSNNYGVHPLDNYLSAILGDQPFELPDLRTDVQIDPARWRAFTGTYEWPAPYGTRIAIEMVADRFPTYVELFRDQRIGLVPQSDASFYLPLYDARCSFDTDAKVPRHIECTAAWADQPIRILRTP